MAIELTPVPYGPEASRALHAAVVAAKAGDALAPVTVVVPTNYVGVAARRLLGSGVLGRVTDGGDGVAGVTFLTVYRLAELLGAPRLAAAHRRPVSTPVLAAAVRAVLADAPGRFRPVAEHPATEAALVAAHRELSTLDDAALDALVPHRCRAPPTSCASAGACAPRSRPSGTTSATSWTPRPPRSAPGVPLLADLGAVVVHLPQELSTPAAALLRALATRVPVTVVAGTSRRRARRRAGARRAGPPRPRAARGRRAARQVATRVVSASDPDDEVRAVVRLVVDAVRDGVPLERMAVLYGAPEPYARLVHEQLEAAGIPHNGAAVRTLADSALGRGLLGLLALPDRDFQRHDVMRLLATTPVHRQGRLVPSASWERISRAAEIVRGPEHWQQRLERYAAHRRGRARGRARGHRPRPAPARATSARLADTRALQDFVATLVRDLAGRSRPRAGATSPDGPSDSSATTSPPESPAGVVARGRAAGGREDRRRARRAWPGSTRSRRRRGSTCSGARSSSSSTPTWGGWAASATGCSWVTSRSASGSTSTGCSCAGWPRGCSPPACTTTRSSPTPTAAPPTARCPCARAGSTTTTAGCSPRWRAQPTSACCCSRAATCAAPPSGCRRGSWPSASHWCGRSRAPPRRPR